MKNSVQKLQHQKLTCVHCGQTYHTPRELAGHIRSQHADTLPSRTAPPKAKQEKKGSRVPVSVAVPSSGAQEHLQRALEGLSQRHRQIDAELARQETLQAEKEAIGKQVGALKLALQAFVGMSGVGSGSQLDIAVAESPELKTSPPASPVVPKGRVMAHSRSLRSPQVRTRCASRCRDSRRCWCPRSSWKLAPPRA